MPSNNPRRYSAGVLHNRSAKRTHTHSHTHTHTHTY